MAPTGSCVCHLRSPGLQFQTQWARFVASTGLVRLLNSIEQVKYVICGHQFFFETLVCLPYPLAVIFVESSQSFDLVM